MKDKNIDVSVSLTVGAVEFKVEVRKEETSDESARIETTEDVKYIDVKAD